LLKKCRAVLHACNKNLHTPAGQENPGEYILRRYTHDARQEVPWDRHDGVRIDPTASCEQTRMSSLLLKLMKLGRARSRSNRACEETNRQLDMIIPGIEMFRRGTDFGLAANERMPSTTQTGILRGARR
jgi:hypothetical protein